MAIEREEVLVYVNQIRDDLRNGFRITHEKQDKTNGRLIAAELKLAVLEDRSEMSKKAVAWTGAGAGAALIGVVEVLKWLTGVIRG